MRTYNPNPLIIQHKDGSKTFIPLAYNHLEKPFSLVITNQQGGELYRGEVSHDTYITLDEREEVVTCEYHPLKGEILTETLRLSEATRKPKKKQADSNVLEKLENHVKKAMDFPEGTDAEVRNHTDMLKKATTDENARKYVTSRIRSLVVGSDIVPPEEVDDYVYELYANLYGMGVLQRLDDDETIGEIMVNATVFPKFQSDIYYIREGRKYVYDKNFRNLDELKNVFSRAVEFNKKELNSVENAIVEATRANKDRVNVIIPEASENYILNIRKFSNFVPNQDMMYESGTVNDEIDRLLEVFVEGKANIGIGGEMGTGKTTTINYLLTKTEPIERKVVIASVSETDVQRVLKGHDVVILNVDEQKDFTFEKLIRTSLRTTASRIIIPESRGGEFKQVYEANLKTKGNMFTAHALDDDAFLDMCTDMYLSSSDAGNESSHYIKDKLAKSIDLVIIMRKVGDAIRIKSISEVALDENRNYKEMNVLYEWVFDPENPLDGHYRSTGNKLSDALKKRLNENGVPMSKMENL